MHARSLPQPCRNDAVATAILLDGARDEEDTRARCTPPPVRRPVSRRRLGVGRIDSCVGPGEGERALMRAILVDAIGCLAGRIGPRPARAKLAEQARRWISTNDVRWPCSFDNVCRALDLEPSQVRRQLLGPDELLGVVYDRLVERLIRW